MASKLTAFLGRLFRPGAAAEEPAAASVEYKGYMIQPLPERSGGQYRVAGVIRKEFPDGVKEHRFIRADTCSTRDEAESFTVDKAQRIIDEQGDRLFRSR